MSAILKPELSQLPFLKIAACSYEGSLFGWDVIQEDEDLTPVVVQGHQEKKKVKKVTETENISRLDAKLSYGFHCTAGSLKCIAVSKNGKYLVTGGMDERIRIFNVKDNKSLGELSSHTGAINALDFFEDSFLISGSDDCNVCIWRIYDWNCVHILGGHKLPINDVAIHPTGKMALSVSKDNTLKLWNLVQGRCAFTRRLRGNSLFICLIFYIFN
jgi:WD40 repeat protein